MAAGARAFADVLDPPVVVGSSPRRGGGRGHARRLMSEGVPQAGSAASMRVLLATVARINDEERRGVTDNEVRTIAAEAGMHVRGTAGYYKANLLTKRDGVRWITDVGRDRLARLGSSEE